MDRKQFIDILSKPFILKDWQRIIVDVFGATRLYSEPRPILLNANYGKAEVAYELGSFNTADDRLIGLYHVTLSENVWLERNKVGLREMLRSIYKYEVDGALIVFEQQNKWRLSFVSDIKVLNDEGELVNQTTEPKRYTYLLGEGEKVRTPADRLSKLTGKQLRLKDILDAFSVEALNEEFYKVVQEFFYGLVGGKIGKGTKSSDFGNGILQLPTANQNVRQEFAVRLIGRTVFCWFLKMKKSKDGVSLLPEQLLSSIAVKNYPDYYRNILERLFFQTLNTPIEERTNNLPEGAGVIPFLNGGLFEPNQDDFYKPSITGLNDYELNISDRWFLNFFEELEKYNFTIDENSVSEVEVSVDPEMLGRIFENLLAEIDPDSGETARKSTGSFYTPREIVEYMATESLVQYIHNQTEIEQERIQPVFKMLEKVEADFTPTERDAILECLEKMKILDPACGSGAFPIGVLQKIVQALQKLDPDASWWKKRQVDRINNAVVKKQLKEKLESSGVEYARKIGVIQNSLYGVDIQPIAAEISKLRCFLSLIVDENIDESKPNRGIEPLPNLEFKFVTADSLMKLPDEKQRNMFDNFEELQQLEGLRDEYIQSYGKAKARVKEQFLKVQQKIAKDQNSLFADTKSKAYKLGNWNPFSHDKSDWFDSKWMFGVEKFDIVIGNPPYKVLTKNNTLGITLDYYLDTYNTIKASSSKNIYIPFIERSITNLLKDKGLLSFIVPEGLFTTRSYNGCVELMKKCGSVSLITTFTSFVFENAVTGNLVFVYSKLVQQQTSKFQFDRLFNLSVLKDDNNPILTAISKSNTIPLCQVATLFKGMVVSDRESVIGDDKSFGQDVFLLGKSIEQWNIVKPFYTNYELLNIVGGTKKKSKHDVAPRIVIRRTGDKLCSAIINSPALTESTLYSCWSTTPDVNNYFLLALLNSNLLTYYIRQSMITNKQAFPQILMTDLEMLPIIRSSKVQQSVFSICVAYLLAIKKAGNYLIVNEYVTNTYVSQFIEEVINAMIMELYFEESFAKAGIELLKYAERDFRSIEGKNEIEAIAIINDVYQNLRQKDNEIRNNIKLMDIKLAGLVMPIKTAIK